MTPYINSLLLLAVAGSLPWWAILLALFLLVYAVLTASNITFEGQKFVLAFLAVAAAVCLIFHK